MKLTEETQATAEKAPTTAMMAGCANFRIDRCADELFAPGLLSVLTQGGVARGIKKSSVSPLIHLLMSPIVMLGIPEGVGHFGVVGGMDLRYATQTQTLGSVHLVPAASKTPGLDTKLAPLDVSGPPLETACFVSAVGIPPCDGLRLDWALSLQPAVESR